MLSNLSNGEAVALVVIVLAIAVAIIVFYEKRRSARLRSQFGESEYERAMAEGGGNRRRAEAKLFEREKRVKSFHLRDLSSSDRARFEADWDRVQAHFVDAPTAAVAEADQLLGEVMSTRGYPVGDFEQRAADISVDHPQVTENYRAAHDIAVRQANGQASTEDLRRAMIHYRALFEDLMGGPHPTTTERPPRNPAVTEFGTSPSLRTR
ncbi:MAG TPA: hypothetical protein VKR52_15270 [Terracidiphilus sp.]|nr:hypothetical protein [Terracidiphilus sp.]